MGESNQGTHQQLPIFATEPIAIPSIQSAPQLMEINFLKNKETKELLLYRFIKL